MRQLGGIYGEPQIVLIAQLIHKGNGLSGILPGRGKTVHTQGLKEGLVFPQNPKERKRFIRERRQSVIFSGNSREDWHKEGAISGTLN